MRPTVFHPVIDHELLRQVEKAAEEAYKLFEAGCDISPQCEKLQQLTGRSICKFDVKAAWGSFNYHVFAKELLINHQEPPKDLSYGEMLEIIEHLYTARGDEFQQSWWLTCLKMNTGEGNISDLIYWPERYLTGGLSERELTPKDILDIALASGKNRTTDF